MADEKHHSRKERRKKHRKNIFCFLGNCFGNSNRVSADHHHVDGKLVKHGKNIISQEKTVLVNDHTFQTSSEIISSSREIHVVENNSQLLAAPRSYELKSNKTRDMIWQKTKSMDETSADRCTRSSIKHVQQQNIITAQETWSKPTTKLSHSVSMPLPRHKKEKVVAAASGEGHKRTTTKKDEEIIIAGKFDSMVGALIIMVTLIVMLIWGKVCAILSAVAWFYFIPRFRATIDDQTSYNPTKLKNQTNHIDLDSWEYKKKVVLQGLLQRNQHI